MRLYGLLIQDGSTSVPTSKEHYHKSPHISQLLKAHNCRFMCLESRIVRPFDGSPTSIQLGLTCTGCFLVWVHFQLCYQPVLSRSCVTSRMCFLNAVRTLQYGTWGHFLLSLDGGRLFLYSIPFVNFSCCLIPWMIAVVQFFIHVL